MEKEKPQVIISEEIEKNTNIETNPAWVGAAIAGGWIYYGNYDDPFQRLYRMRLDGSDDQLVE